ncbi:MAG TPA: lipid-binding SYLF domain-containing protein [Candidatus Angelobacter sp.]|jgi:lipid-binding SYLF domain-containing protein
MKRAVGVVVAFLGLFASIVWADSGEKERDRIKEASNVLKEILEAPDKGIPGNVLDGSKCVIVIPGVKKAALGIGASYGRGVMTCRQGNDFKGPWSPPSMMATESGSVGFQIGGSGTDFVILVLNEGGARSVMKSKVKLGADASIAAGPVGRTAEASTTGTMKAQMLSYSRSRGVFGGVSLSGASLRVDGDANKNLYGDKVSVDQIIQGQGITTPEEAKPLIEQLTAATSKAAPAAQHQ